MITKTFAPVDIILPEICAGFSHSVWTQMRSLACSLADGVLPDAILISPCTPLLPNNVYREGVVEKSTETVTKKGLHLK